MKKFFGIVLFIIAILLIGMQYLIPTFIEAQIEENFTKRFDAQKVESKVSAFPAYDLLYGTMDDLNVKMAQVRLENGLKVSELNIQAKDIKFNAQELVSNKNLQIDSVENCKVEAIIEQKEFNEFLKENFFEMPNTEINIKNNQVVLTSDLNIMAGMFNGKIEIKGNLLLKDNTLVFAPIDFSIKGRNVLGFNKDVLHDVKIYNFNDFPMKVQAYKLVTENEKLHLFFKPEGI